MQAMTASLGPEDEQYDKSQCRADRRQLNENLVTNKVAKAAARMVQLMVLQLSLNFQNLIIEPGQVSIWEVCCSPTSSFDIGTRQRTVELSADQLGQWL